MNNFDVDIEKAQVEYRENAASDTISELDELPRIKPNTTNRTYANATIQCDGDVVYFGNMVIDRSEFTKLLQGQSQQHGHVGNCCERQLDGGTKFRPLGNPVPLGLVGYGISTFTLGLVLMEVRGATNPNLLISSSLALSGLVTLICGLWCLLLDNTFAATALGAFGGFYLSYAIILIDTAGISSTYNTVEDFNNVMAFWLTGWTIYAFLMWINTFKGTVEFCVLIGVIVLYLITLTAHYYTNSHSCKVAAGAFAFISALIAFYCVWAMNAIESTSHIIPPVLMMPGHKRKSRQL